MELIPCLRSELLTRLNRGRRYSPGLEQTQGEEACQCRSAKYERRLSSREVVYRSKKIFCRFVFQLCGGLVEAVGGKMRELADLRTLLVKLTRRCMQGTSNGANHRGPCFHLLVHNLTEVVPETRNGIGSGSFELIGRL
jgi:hypothetical protein